MRKRVALGLGAALLVGGLAAEVGVRVAGLVDFPLYDADATIGYIPKANQRGSFLNKNDWVINEKHMGAETFVPDPAGNILLVGDSIVWGGNPYALPDRLGPRLQALVKGKVWPIAAGSWSLQNQLAYLNANPDVVSRVDTIVFVLNSGDLGPPSSWNCSLTHQRERSTVALIYLAKKYVLRWPCEGTPAELQLKTQDPLVILRAFIDERASGGRVIAFLYPDRPQSQDEALMRDQLEIMAPPLRQAAVKEVHLVGRDPRWQGRADVYRDGIHPSPAGVETLAGIIATGLRSN